MARLSATASKGIAIVLQLPDGHASPATAPEVPSESRHPAGRRCQVRPIMVRGCEKSRIESYSLSGSTILAYQAAVIALIVTKYPSGSPRENSSVPVCGLTWGSSSSGCDENRVAPCQGHAEIVDTEEQEEAVARRRVIGAHQGGMLVGAPLVDAKQDSPIRVQELPKVGMGWRRLGLAEQRLVPAEAARHIAYPDNRPRALHGPSCGPTRQPLSVRLSQRAGSASAGTVAQRWLQG